MSVYRPISESVEESERVRACAREREREEENERERQKENGGEGVRMCTLLIQFCTTQSNSFIQNRVYYCTHYKHDYMSTNMI